ncbi:hypothetical protein [Demequina lutea]|uniref:Uncharacterized protein n=1 Tax=Demequina lutea TaxID=431489 RepID=A0A7Z0CLC2_9MICO|nr:hypothetical protein [Demequina lutea]NYI42752.1 hypothetical protein [Demequina lutea]
MTAITRPAMSAELVVVKVACVALVVFKKLSAEPSPDRRFLATGASASTPLPTAIAESEGAPHGDL